MNVYEATDHFKELVLWAREVVVNAKANPATIHNPRTSAVLELLANLIVGVRANVIPMVWVSRDVITVILHAAKLLDARALAQIERVGVDNPWTGTKTDVSGYQHPADSKIADFNVVYFETPISFGHPLLLLHGLASLPTSMKDAPGLVLLPLGLYARNDLQRLEPETVWPSIDPIPALIDESERELQIRFDYALHQFSSQSLICADFNRIPRAARRRWGRECDLELPELMTIRLRRVQHTGGRDGDSRSIEWSHRWLVDGHWRNQWYPSSEDHRPVWIEGYVKGPDDKPLILKERRIVINR